MLGRHCDSGSTLFSQRAFYYEAVRFVSDIWKCTNFIFLLRLSVKQKKFVVLYPMAEDYRYDIFFSFLINLYRWHIASMISFTIWRKLSYKETYYQQRRKTKIPGRTKSWIHHLKSCLCAGSGRNSPSSISYKDGDAYIKRAIFRIADLRQLRQAFQT